MTEPARRTVKELRDLHVTRVDLVSRAAVRDPDNPDQPTRFLVMKSEAARPCVPSATPQDAAFEEIKKAAASTQGENETFEQAITRVTSEQPDLYRRYLDAGQPVRKSAMFRDTAREEIERLAKREQETNPALSDEQAITVVMADRSNKGVVQRYKANHYAAGQQEEPSDVRKADARHVLDRLIETELRTAHVSKAEATAKVTASEPGRSAWAILLGNPVPAKPSLPVNKASGPAAEIETIAKSIQRSGKAKNYADALVRAARENPRLYDQYLAAMREQSSASPRST